MFYFWRTQLAHRQSHREGRRGSICLVLTKRKHFDKRRENKSERLRQRKEVVPSSLCRVMRAMSRPSLSVDSSPAHTHTRRKGQLNYLQNMRKAFAKNLSKILFRFSKHNWSGQLVLVMVRMVSTRVRWACPSPSWWWSGTGWRGTAPFLIPHQPRPALLVGTTTTPPPSTWSILSSSSWILNVALGYQSNL